MAPVQKGLSASQCARSDIEKDQMKGIPYASAVGSVDVRPDVYTAGHCLCCGFTR